MTGFLEKLCVLLFFLSSLIACGNLDKKGNSDNIFSNILVSNLKNNQATISFNTTSETTCEIQYGLSQDNLNLIATNPMMAPNQFLLFHEVTLYDLSADTTYFFRSSVTDQEGANYFSSSRQFTTTSPSTQLTDKNVALYSEGTRVVDISSNFAGNGLDSTYGGNKAIDGRLSTAWSSNNDGDSAFITLDFGQKRLIKGFGFQSRKMLDGTSIILKLKLVFDNGLFELGPYDTTDPDQLYNFDFIELIDVTKVKIQAVNTTGGNTGVSEIQFYSSQ